MCVQIKLHSGFDETEIITKPKEHIFTQLWTHTYLFLLYL